MGKFFAIGSKDLTNNLCYIFTKSGNLNQGYRFDNYNKIKGDYKR